MKFNSVEDTYTLNNGVKIPIIGFGTWQTPDGDVAKHVVEAALNSGYRHIDTAAAYGNEESVEKELRIVALTAMTYLLLLNFGMQIMVIKRQKLQLIKVCKI